jgi:hypothetical protein
LIGPPANKPVRVGDLFVHERQELTRPKHTVDGLDAIVEILWPQESVTSIPNS